MEYTYPAIFYEEENGEYTGIFPDLDHLTIAAKTYNDILVMSYDVLENYILNLLASKTNLPKATKLKDVDLACEDKPNWNYKVAIPVDIKISI